MPLERVGARKEVPAVVAKGYFQRVLPFGVAMSFEVFLRLEPLDGTELAPDLANRTTCPVGLLAASSTLYVPRLELSRVFVLRLLPLLLRQFLFHTLLNPISCLSAVCSTLPY